MIQFASTAIATSVLRPADVAGHLLVVTPKEFKTDVNTSMGQSDAILVEVHDITTSESHTDVMWFSKVLVSTLKTLIGQQVLAVMDQGLAKPGQSAPWILKDASGEPKAVEAATAYLTGQVAAQITAPAPVAEGSDDLMAALASLGAKPVK